jgi:hypothetical protein
MDTKPTDELPAIPDVPRAKPSKEASLDANQGEGDRASARAYDNDLREFINEGRVPTAAREARAFVETDPVAAAKAEREAKRGPKSHLADMVERVVDKVRNAIKK